MNWIAAEKEFESWYNSKLAFAHKFEDARAVISAVESRKVIVKGQPSDYHVTENGVAFYAEVKSCENPTSFPFSNIKKPQWRAAILVSAANGSYFFFIRKEPERLWYRVPAPFFISLQADNVKSVKWEHLERFRYVRVS